MKSKNTIVSVTGKEILDSRGNPTLEATVKLGGGAVARACVPSGASTGQFEAHELRDGDKERYGGKGVLTAVSNINNIIQPALLNKNAANLKNIDNILLELDGTENKEYLGANAILAVSIAVARAVSSSMNIPLYKLIGGLYADTLPVPMMKILTGGAHSKNNLDIQEFMVVPTGKNSFAQALQVGTEIYHSLGKLLAEKRLSTCVGDEGGFAPDVSCADEAIELIITAAQNIGYMPYCDFYIALDVAASEWYKDNIYYLPKTAKTFTTCELIESIAALCDKFPIISVEDPLAETDYDGWTQLTERLGGRVLVVGDDLFVTNTKRLQKGFDLKMGNAILIKPNQIGSLSETLETIKMAKSQGYKVIISHRSGETEDTTIADIAVGVASGLIKTGAPCRSERTSKYNRLLTIEQSLGKSAVFLGKKAFEITKSFQ
ncbi:MAG: phosphopyruvate hydratase [Oscillospiraceae bacterium]